MLVRTAVAFRPRCLRLRQRRLSASRTHGAGAAWYGVALACAGVVYGFGLRAWAPAWLDADAREHAAVVAVTASWLAFERVYAGSPQVGTGVHVAAAAFYVMCALTDRRRIVSAQLTDITGVDSMSLAPARLYAAGLTIAVGCLDALRALTGSGGMSALALPMFALALTFAAAGVAVRRWRRSSACTST